MSAGSASLTRSAVALAALLLVSAVPAVAHLGSPDVFLEGNAGEYRMLVVVRMPRVIPGIAEVEVRPLSIGVRSVRVTPMRIRGLGSELQPAADIAQPGSDRPGVYRAQLWLMLRGAWKVHAVADGDRGTGELFVPVGAVSSVTLPMRRSVRWVLGALALLLVAGAVAIVGASVREGTSRPGIDPTDASVRRGRWAMAIALALISGVLSLGGVWWRAAADDAAAVVYQTPEITGTLTDPRTLSLTTATQDRIGVASGVGQARGDLVPDHGHLMHLFLVRAPGMDMIAHLHPRPTALGKFEQTLPSMPAGRYRMFADVVHDTGFPETAIGEVTLPDIVSGLPLDDDAAASADPLVAGPQTSAAPLSMGYRMQWLNAGDTLRAGEPLWLKFRVENRSGVAAGDLEPYMGMPGHLIVVRWDWQVFAHLHPAGSAPMASVALANGPAMVIHAGHGPSAAELTFPYGFPQAGAYRLFVQIKRAGRVETAAFDAQVGRVPRN
jgi:hypothetical protein